MPGTRIYLRKLVLDDVDTKYYRWMSNPEVIKFLECRFYENSMQSLRKYVEKISLDPTVYFWAICTKQYNEHIGNIKLGPVDPNHLSADIGVIIGETQFWRRGYAAEAISVLVDFAFSTLHLHKVTAGCYSNNKGSEKAFMKCGFQIEGIRRQHCLFEGKYVDVILLGLINPGRSDKIESSE